MLGHRPSLLTRACALLAAAHAALVAPDFARAQSGSFAPPAMPSPYESLVPANVSPYPMTASPGAPMQWAGQPVMQATPVGGGGYPTSANWVVQGDGCQSAATLDTTVGCDASQWPQQSWFDPPNPQAWDWQMLPAGLIYRSYWAGVK